MFPEPGSIAVPAHCPRSAVIRRGMKQPPRLGRALQQQLPNSSFQREKTGGATGFISGKKSAFFPADFLLRSLRCCCNDCLVQLPGAPKPAKQCVYRMAELYQGSNGVTPRRESDGPFVPPSTDSWMVCTHLGHRYDMKSHSVASRTHTAASLAFDNFKMLSQHICSSHGGIYI